MPGTSLSVLHELFPSLYYSPHFTKEEIKANLLFKENYTPIKLIKKKKDDKSPVKL